MRLPRLRSLTLRDEIAIAAPPASVWAVFQALEAWPRWNAVCLSAQWTSGDGWQLGSTFRMRLRMAGVPMSFLVRIYEADPPRTVAWASTVLGVTGDRRFRFEARDGWTHVKDTKAFTSPILPLRLLYPRPIIHAMSREWLRSLKARVEAGASRQAKR